MMNIDEIVGRMLQLEQDYLDLKLAYDELKKEYDEQHKEMQRMRDREKPS